MKKMTKRIISIILTLCLTFLATVPVLAADEEEEYLADLRLIYADDYDEAAEILEDSNLEGYKIFDANLNENTGKSGVYLAYLTTTDIEDAITDISVMQMEGGYKEGNYREMIAQSLAEYEKIGNIYLEAIDYFVKAYNAGDFLAISAYRQLNLYAGLDEHEDERLGDIFRNGITNTELATMFMEGNIHVLDNVRSLLAMGVSYNEDGKHYLEKVADEAAKYTADKNIYLGENLDELASVIAGNILTFGDMFTKLMAHEGELDYTDETFTELELEYAEYTSFADRMREVDYLNGKTLYDFCLEYKFNSDDLSSLYPLAAALNDGQQAITRASHYYDVVLYSMADFPEEIMETEIAALEEKYSDFAFDVYAGVDRSIYDDTFALTSAAYRADAYTADGFGGYLTNPSNGWGITTFTTAGISVACAVWGICRTVKASMMTNAAYNAVQDAQMVVQDAILRSTLNNGVRNVSLIASSQQFFGVNAEIKVAGKILQWDQTGDDVVNALFEKVFPTMIKKGHDYDTKLLMLKSAPDNLRAAQMTDFEENLLDNLINKGLKDENFYEYQRALKEAKAASEQTAQTVNGMTGFTHALYVAGGISLLLSAISLGYSIYNYYHPDYDDIPTAMVDLIDTKDGDRYIKYDVVYEVEPQADGTLIAGDLNAFSANRWNAMYYTKSYEAGKPLLAGEFVISTNNNVPGEKHMPVHRFGEVVSYNLNKYNFNDDHSIYLSVKQSDNQKKAVADVPEIIGSVFSAGYYFLAGGIGIAAGVGGTIGTMEIIKRRKNKTTQEPEVTEEV